MLILTRNINESIVLEYPNGNKVIIEVLAVRGKQVRIGLDAPKEIDIARSELLKD